MIILLSLEDLEELGVQSNVHQKLMVQKIEALKNKQEAPDQAQVAQV